MLDNLQLFLNNLSLFLISLSIVILVLFLLKTVIKIKYKNSVMLKFNVFKLLFLFITIYLFSFILYTHKQRPCNELVESAQCNCFALKLSEEKDILKKYEIAEDAQKICTKSNFFKKWILLFNKK